MKTDDIVVSVQEMDRAKFELQCSYDEGELQMSFEVAVPLEASTEISKID